MNNIGLVLRRLRRQKRVSQFELEIECGFSTGMLSRIENGQTNPTKETLVKIAVCLKLDKEEILELFGINQIIGEYTN